MAKQATDKKFEDYFRDGMEDIAKTAFPTLSKFMDFSREKKKDEDSASDSVSETEEDDKPRKRRKNKSQTDSVANEMVLDSLGAIDERLKVQNIVLVSQLEQSTLTNQFLARLVDGGGIGGFGSSAGGGAIGGALGDVAGAIGGASIGNFIKTWGSKLLGGAGSLLAPEISIPTAIGGYALTQMDKNQEATTKYFKDNSNSGGVDVDSDGNPIAPTANSTAKINENDKKIQDLEDMLGKIEQHLKLNNDSEAERLRYAQQELEIQKKIKELRKEETNSGPHGVVGPGSNGGTISSPTGGVASETVATAVKKAIPDNIPIPNGNDRATHIAIGAGETPLSMARGGQLGTPVGGSDPHGSRGHTAGVSGTRSSGGGSKDRLGNQSEAWKFFKSKGYSDEETSQIMGQIEAEGNFNPQAHNKDDAGPGRDSDGIAQWNDGPAAHPTNRRQNMMDFVSQQNGGKPYNELTPAQQYTGQLGFIDHELHTNYKGAYEKLKSGDYKGFGHAYEGYASAPDQNGENTRFNNGQRILARGRSGQFDRPISPGGDGGQDDGANYQPKNSKEVLDHLQEMKNRGMITNDQCVSLATAAVGIKLGDGQEGSNVHQWRGGENVMMGTMKPGTPIATFMDEHNQGSNLYAGGGSGTPGANRDHAAIFEGYTRDENGAITGIDVAEQYHGSSMHNKHYDITGEMNEKNASVYRAIKTQGGGYLGGKRNPMTPQEAKSGGYRPEDSLPVVKGVGDTPSSNDIGKEAAENLAQHNYDKIKSSAPHDRDIGIQAHANDILHNHAALKDTQSSVSSMLVRKSHEDAIKQAAESKKPPLLQQFNSHSSENSLTKVEKSARLSGKDVGDPNPPTERLKVLFASDANKKGF